MIEFYMQGNILDANRNFLRTVGYTLDELRGRHHSMFCNPEFAKSREYRDFWADFNEGTLSLRADGEPADLRHPAVRAHAAQRRRTGGETHSS